ncbi:MAG: DUF2029 domain-containing protein [Planctomycetota bacterium]|nr:MAG: DUF2029 domain-containing protein [Planctomycetota bacterium]
MVCPGVRRGSGHHGKRSSRVHSAGGLGNETRGGRVEPVALPRFRERSGLRRSAGPVARFFRLHETTMDIILRGYEVNEPTWFYLSTVLILAVFFRFGRWLSLRNLDLLLLLAISPGLLLTKYRPEIGHAWLFVGAGVLLVRLLLDPLCRRRPKLEINLNRAGTTFLCLAAFAFLMTKVLTEPPPDTAVATVREASRLLKLDAPRQAANDGEAVPGPAARLLAAPVVPTSRLVAQGPGQGAGSSAVEQLAARILAVLSHAAVVCGLLMIGRTHFGDVTLGISMATLYLLVPCTAYDVAKVNHVLPAALALWAFALCHRPFWAGCLMGLAAGVMFFPLFLIPLWWKFYGRRACKPFLAGLATVAAALLLVVLIVSPDVSSVYRQTIGAIDWSVLQFRGGTASGFWSQHNEAYRLPVMVAAFVLYLALTFVPWRKTPEHLLAQSTAIILATQLWYPQQGGAYVLWYLPSLIAVVFRPRLFHSPAVLLGHREQRSRTEDDDVQESEPATVVMAPPLTPPPEARRPTHGTTTPHVGTRRSSSPVRAPISHHDGNGAR